MCVVFVETCLTDNTEENILGTYDMSSHMNAGMWGSNPKGNLTVATTCCVADIRSNMVSCINASASMQHEEGAPDRSTIRTGSRSLREMTSNNLTKRRVTL